MTSPGSTAIRQATGDHPRTPRDLRIGLLSHGARCQWSVTLHSVVTRAVIVPRRLASRTGLGSSRGLARLSRLPDDGGLVGADHVPAVGASRVLVHAAVTSRFRRGQARIRHMFGRASERVLATCGLFGDCTYECRGDSSTVVSPSREAPPVSPPATGGREPLPYRPPGLEPPGLEGSFKRSQGIPVGNVCRITVHSAACDLAVFDGKPEREHASERPAASRTREAAGRYGFAHFRWSIGSTANVTPISRGPVY